MQGLHLGNLGDAAEDDGAAQMGVAAVGVEARLDLQSELPGGGEDEGANRPGSPQRLPVDPANRIFCQALESANGRSIIVRTMDIGGDKPVEALGLEQEQNAFLGYRAIRICLDRPELFLTQLRALLRASAFGKVQIMFPMIANLEEFRRSKKYV